MTRAGLHPECGAPALGSRRFPVSAAAVGHFAKCLEFRLQADRVNAELPTKITRCVNGGTPLFASSSLGAPTTGANGTINIGNSFRCGSGTLRYTGTGETTDRVINLHSATSGGTIDQSGTRPVEVYQRIHSHRYGGKTLTLQGSTAGTGEIAGAIVNNS